MPHQKWFLPLTFWSCKEENLLFELQKANILFDLIQACQKFSLDLDRLEYRKEDQIFSECLTFFGDPETKVEFESRLPIFRLIDKKGRETEIDSKSITKVSALLVISY